MAPWLNWIEFLTTDQKVRGSNPFGVTLEVESPVALHLGFCF